MGFAEGGVGMVQYAPVMVKLPGDDCGGQEQTFKQADLTVYAKSGPMPEAAGQEDLHLFAGFRQTQQLSPEGKLQLTPVNSPPRGSIAPVILGIAALRRLHVTVEADKALLCPVEHSDDWGFVL